MTVPACVVLRATVFDCRRERTVLGHFGECYNFLGLILTRPWLNPRPKRGRRRWVRRGGGCPAARQCSSEMRRTRGRARWGEPDLATPRSTRGIGSGSLRLGKLELRAPVTAPHQLYTPANAGASRLAARPHRCARHLHGGGRHRYMYSRLISVWEQTRMWDPGD